ARAGAWLAGRIEPGDRVLLVAGTSLGFLRCYLGAVRAGAGVVLATPAGTVAEFGHLVSDSGARLALSDPGPAERLGGMLPVVGASDLGAALDGGGPVGGGDQAGARRPGPGDTALL